MSDKEPAITLNSRDLLTDEICLQVGRGLVDMLQSLGDVHEVSPEELRNFEITNGYIQVWRQQKLEIEILTNQLAAADAVVEAAAGQPLLHPKLQAAALHYLALRQGPTTDSASSAKSSKTDPPPPTSPGSPSASPT